MIKSWKILHQSPNLTNHWDDKQLSKDLPKLKKQLSPLRKTWIRKYLNPAVCVRCVKLNYLSNSFVVPTRSYLVSSNSIKLYNKSQNWLQSQTVLLNPVANLQNAIKFLNFLRLTTQSNFFVWSSFLHSGSSEYFLSCITTSFNLPRRKIVTLYNQTPLGLLRLKHL